MKNAKYVLLLILTMLLPLVSIPTVLAGEMVSVQEINITECYGDIMFDVRSTGNPRVGGYDIPGCNNITLLNR
jgi:hypothetical protein